MEFEKSKKKATGRNPQCVALVIDNSGSMADKLKSEQQTKAEQVTSAVQDMVITMQSQNLGSSLCRYILSLGAFGDSCRGLAVAASPAEIDIDKLVFRGDAGGTDIPIALQWAEGALRKSLERCRNTIPNYDEEVAPNPLCVFLTDGEDTSGGNVEEAAKALHSIPFKNGSIDTFAVGVGLQDEHFKTMTVIASSPDYAIRLAPEGIADFLAEVAHTLLERSDVNRLAAKR